MKTIEINYHGETYSCRVLLSNDGEELIIASTKLLDKLMPYPMTDTCNGFADKEAERIDEKIFYYVTKDDLALSDNELRDIVSESNPEWFD